MKRVKCYGGPLHGEIISCEKDRFEALLRPRLNRAGWCCDPLPTIDMETLVTVTYMIETFSERRGVAHREIKVAVIEGPDNLLCREEWEIEYDLGHERWHPVEQPKILREFDSWFNWCVYRHTAKEKYLVPEFCKPRMT